VFEPVHGAASISKEESFKPTSILLSARLMLQWLGAERGDKQATLEGDRIENAILRMLTENKKTKDLGGTLTTEEFTRGVMSYLYVD
jgi:3-isopropylmalate dehydrogenase